MPAQAPAQRRQPQEEQGGGFTMTKLMIGAAFYFGVNFFLNWVNQKSQTGVTVTDANGNKIVIPSNTGDIPAYELRPAKLDEGATFSLVPEKVAPIWPQDSYIDIVVTLSPSFNPQPVSKTPEEYIVLREENFHMNNYSDKRAIDTKFTVPKDVQNNGTLWGHFYIGLHGATLDPKLPNFDPGKAFHFAHPLTQHLPKKKVSKTRNLLEAKSETEEPEEEVPAGPVMANYYHPNASFSFVPNSGVQEISKMPPILGHFLNFESTHARDSTGKHGWYYPVLFVNTFWQLTTHMTLLNDTVKELPLHIDLDNMAMWKFTLLANIEANSKENARKAAFGNPVPGTGDGTEIEMVKEIFIDTNPILLAITAVVSVAHVILETLAFGSDIAHYRKKKDNVGISVRSILANIFMQAVILLYLIDNSQNTSWMILGGQLVGIVIEFWKITTVVDVKFKPTPAGSVLPYWIYFEDKKQLTETEEKTKEYDEIAFKYMYMLAVPLLIAYGIYSLIYDSHKSWYSFIITTLVGSVYTYGFLMMIPSLYINYRLKSVAHMPGRAMVYKFLNTFIDDLFAFTIKMPLLHRLATFRDDLIFFVYLYQHFNYKTDYTRVNEFGQGGDDEDDAAAKPKAEAEAKKVTADDVKKIEEKVTAKAKASGADVGAATKRK